jgi:hypothetical protein
MKGMSPLAAVMRITFLNLKCTVIYGLVPFVYYGCESDFCDSTTKIDMKRICTFSDVMQQIFYMPTFGFQCV